MKYTVGISHNIHATLYIAPTTNLSTSHQPPIYPDHRNTLDTTCQCSMIRIVLAGLGSDKPLTIPPSMASKRAPNQRA